MGAHVDVEVKSGERLSLQFPGDPVVGAGTWDCEALVAQLTVGGHLLRERVFGGVEDLLGCLFVVSPSSEPVADELDVDLGDAPALDLPPPAPDLGGTIPEAAEYLGTYSSIPAYLRAMLEPEVSAACSWILDHLDYVAVQRRWEQGGSRLVLERGHVYRVAAPGS